MTPEEILDRFSDDEIRELERYYFGTISGAIVCHDTLLIAGLLMRLTLQERDCLADWAEANFSKLSPLPWRTAA